MKSERGAVIFYREAWRAFDLLAPLRFGHGLRNPIERRG
jgi:hypothetical protein